MTAPAAIMMAAEAAEAAEAVLPIPSVLNAVNTDWVADLLYKVLRVPRPAKTDGTHNGITLLQIRANATEGFHESCRVTVRCASEERARHFIVEIVPSDPDLKEIIVKHRLFAREKTIHEEVLPMLKEYVRSRPRSPGKAVEVNFSAPNFVYGDYDEERGEGVMVFEDYAAEGYAVDDPVLMLVGEDHVRDVVQGLATFHAICVAHDLTEDVKLSQKFPILSGEKSNTWFQEDMSDALDEMYTTCQNFLEVTTHEFDLRSVCN